MHSSFSNLISKILFFCLLGGIFTFAATGASLPPAMFVENSVLANGHWVKVGVTSTGIYEISYSELREMGFSDPSKVTVFGHGGRTVTEHFRENGKNYTYNGDILPVAVYHKDEKLYFYGLGVEHIAYTPSAGFSLPGTFVRKSFNIYSQKGYYLLTDSQPVVEPKSYSVGTDNATLVERGVGYNFHEQDLEFNPTFSGQLFWGEEFTTSKTKYSFPLPLTDLDNSIDGVIKAEVYYDLCQNRTFKATIRKSGGSMSLVVPSAQMLNFTPLAASTREIALIEEDDNLDLSFALYSTTSKGYLDYWILSYSKFIPKLASEAQSFITLPKVGKNVNYKISLSETRGDNILVWDVSTPSAPVAAEIRDGFAWMQSGTNTNPDLVFFDTARKQLTISGYEDVCNSNLHADVANGAEYLIITTNTFRTAAERIANAHRNANGTKVIVATVDEIYNEYSDGVPDPMAYRWLARMLFENSEHPLRNILLFGPMTSDIRGLQQEKNPSDYIIAYQYTNINRSIGAPNYSDFIGIMEDYFSGFAYSEKVDIGVGVLPVKSLEEANIMAEKTENYLAEEDFAYYLNRYSYMTCPGDNHMSDISGIAIENVIQDKSSKSLVITPIIADAYPTNPLARRKMLDSFQEGNLFYYYIGHGDPTGFATTMNLMRPMNIREMRNTRLPFGMLAGCSLSDFDKNTGGIGDKIIMATPNGLIGGLVSSRETYANENQNITTVLVESILYENADENNPRRRKGATTIGEIVADTKSRLKIPNEAIYSLMADPELVVPFPSLDINVSDLKISESGRMDLSGIILDYDKKMQQKNFNGKLVARILAPKTTVACGNYTSRTDLPLDIEYDDNTLVITEAEVTDGKFSLSILLTKEMKDIAIAEVDENGKPTDKYLTIALAAYDKSIRTGAASRIPLNANVLPEGGASEVAEDNIAPVIESFDYSPATRAIEFSISDNVGLNLSSAPLVHPIGLKIDGTYLTNTLSCVENITDNSCRASFRVYLENLPTGYHNACLEVSDLAGNSTEAELTFTVGFENFATMTLVAERKNASSIILSTNVPVTDETEIIVTDLKGNRVASGIIPVGGSQWEWNIDADEYSAVGTGLYKGYSRSNATGSFSRIINIPVVRVTTNR